MTVSLVANGMAFDEILQEYPVLETEDIRQALQYAASLASEEVLSAGRRELMRFLADVGVSVSTAEMLRQRGHEVVHLSEGRPAGTRASSPGIYPWVREAADRLS